MTNVAPLQSADDPVLIRRLNQLIALHRAALDACEQASFRISQLRARVDVRELVREHLGRIEELSRCVAQLGGRPTHDVAQLSPSPLDIQQLGEDADVLDALLEDESQLAEAYEQLAGVQTSSAPVASVIAHGRSRQQRRRVRLQAWRESR